MKKPSAKKSYSKFKADVPSTRFKSSSQASNASFVAHTEKPIRKGKEDRLAGTRTRNETRVFSGYTPRTAHGVNSVRKSYAPKSIESNEQTNYSRPSFASSGRLPRSPLVDKPKAVPDTSWGDVADWYNKHLEKGDDTYHTKVLFPNLLRMLGDMKGKKILDMACGQGIFAEQLRDKGAFVTGVDIAKELITLAEEKSKTIKEKGTHKVIYHVTSADDLFMLKDESFDVVVCVLALQNIENLQKTISEAKRVLTSSGVFLFVLNHPSFRNPKQTYWGYNEKDEMQYRRVDEYMSESHVRIDMTPGSIENKKFTVSFHRPLQVYIKALVKSGMAVTRLEEWVSHRESERGPKKKAEDKARKEIPLFMCIEGKNISI